jgi:hypothetical protein
MAIAYYNLGCQQEHLKNLESAASSYQMATQIERNKNNYNSDLENEPVS